MTAIPTEGSARPWGAFARVEEKAPMQNQQRNFQTKRCKSALRGEGRALPGQAGRGVL